MQQRLEKKNTLLYVYISTHFREIIRIAHLLKNDVNYNPKVFFVTPYEGWNTDFKRCEKEGIDCFTYFDTTISPPKKRKLTLPRVLLAVLRRIRAIKNKFKQILINKIRRLKGILTHSQLERMNSIFSASFYAKMLLKGYKYIWLKKPQYLPALSKIAYGYYKDMPILLQKHQIQLIIFPEHNLFYFTQLLVYMGKKLDIPAVIVPYTIANTLEWSEAFYDIPARTLNSKINKVFAHAFPHWVNIYKGRSLLLPVELILIHEMFQITPKNPWLLNSGTIDFLAAESLAMNSYYVAAGIEPNRLRTTGALYYDELYLRMQEAHEHRRKLYQTLNLVDDKPMIVCALPPNQFSGREELIDFSTYEQAVRFLLESLTHYSRHFHIIINLHPRIVPESVDYIKEYPAKIFSGDVAQIIPLSHLYVATCSATIRMAISCGIPVINYDLYRYNYDDYTDVKGVITLFERADFKSTLQHLLVNRDFYQQTKQLQEHESAQWGILDGKAGANLLKEIDTL